MEEKLVGFLIWVALGIVFCLYGIYVVCSPKQKPFGFWANAEQFPVRDVKGYNRALGILFFAFGVIFALLGLPLLSGQNSAGIMLSVLGTMLEVIVMMGIYILVIEKKYREK